MRPSSLASKGRREATDEEIRHRAYELYLARGDEPGSDLSDWLQAERDCNSE